MPKKTIYGVLALALASCGTLVGANPSNAAEPFDFPRCSRTTIDSDTIRVWVDPGSYETDTVFATRGPRRNDVKMFRRLDGIWVADIPKPEKRYDNYIYFQLNTDQGTWIKCRKVKP